MPDTTTSISQPAPADRTADAAFAGKAFLWSLGAPGGNGPGHLIYLFRDKVETIP